MGKVKNRKSQEDKWQGNVLGLYFWQGSRYVCLMVGLPPPQPEPAGIWDFAKLNPGRGQGKAAKSLAQSMGDFAPLLNSSIRRTGWSSKQGISSRGEQRSH